MSNIIFSYALLSGGLVYRALCHEKNHNFYDVRSLNQEFFLSELYQTYSNVKYQNVITKVLT